MLRTIKSVQYKTSQTCGSHLRLLEGHEFAQTKPRLTYIWGLGRQRGARGTIRS